MATKKKNTVSSKVSAEIQKQIKPGLNSDGTLNAAAKYKARQQTQKALQLEKEREEKERAIQRNPTTQDKRQKGLDTLLYGQDRENVAKQKEATQRRYGVYMQDRAGQLLQAVNEKKRQNAAQSMNLGGSRVSVDAAQSVGSKNRSGDLVDSLLGDIQNKQAQNVQPVNAAGAQKKASMNYGLVDKILQNMGGTGSKKRNVSSQMKTQPMNSAPAGGMAAAQSAPAMQTRKTGSIPMADQGMINQRFAEFQAQQPQKQTEYRVPLVDPADQMRKWNQDYQKQQDEYNKTLKEYNNYLEVADLTGLSTKEERDYARQYFENKKKELEKSKSMYDDPGYAKERRIGELEYRQTPQGEIRYLYDNSKGLDRINTIIRDNPDIFAKYDLPEYISWTGLNDVIDQIAPRVGDPSNRSAQAQMDKLIASVDDRIKEIDKAEALWGDINRLEAGAKGLTNRGFNPDEIVHRNISDEYEGWGINTGDETLTGVSNDLERSYVIANNRYYYQNEPVAGKYYPETYMTDEQANTFTAYMNAGQREEAEAYLNALRPYLNNKLTTSRKEAWNNFMESSPVLEGLARAGSWGMNLLGTVPSVVGIFGSLLGNKEAQDPNSAYYYLTNMGQNIGSEHAQLQGERFVKMFNNKDAYNVGVFVSNLTDSMANNTIALALGGGVGGAANVSKAAVQLIMSSEAAASAMVENLNRGLDPTQAALMAIGTGGIEWLTEEVSLEQLLDPNVKEMLGSWKSKAVFLGKNILAEGSEEGASSVLDMVMDKAFSLLYNNKTKIQAEMDAYVQRMMAENPNYTSADVDQWRKEGVKAAWGGFWSDTLTDMASGALSGFFMSGARVAMNDFTQNVIGKNVRSGGLEQETGFSNFLKNIGNKGSQSSQISQGSKGALDNSNISYLLKIGQSMNEETGSNELATSLNEKLRKGGKISNHELGRLTQLISMESGENIARETEKTATEIVKDRLKDMGVGVDEALQQAQTVVKATMQGIESLNREEKDILKGSIPAFDIYQAMVKPEKMGESKAAQNAKNAAAAVNFGVQVMTGEELENMRTVQEIAKGRSVNELIGKDHLMAAAQYVPVHTVEAAEISEKGGDANYALSVLAKGEAAVIDGIKDGKVQIKTAEGKTEGVRLADIQTANPQVAQLVSYMRKYQGAVSDEVASKALAQLDTLGEKAGGRFIQDILKLNMDAHRGKQMPHTSLAPAMAEEIWKTAKAEHDQAEANRVTGEGKTVQPGQGGLRYGDIRYGTKEWTDTFKDMDQGERDQLNLTNRLAKMLGLDFEVYVNGSEEGRAIQGSQSGNRVRINLAGTILDNEKRTGGPKVTINVLGQEVALNSEETIRNVLAAAIHEPTHWLQKNSREGYAKLMKFTMDYLQSHGMDVEQEILNKISLYNGNYQNSEDQQGRKMTIEDAVYEIVANSAENLWASEEFQERLKNSDPELHRTMKDHIRDFIKRVRSALQDLSKHVHREARKFDVKALDEMARIWLGAYDDVIHGYATGETQEKITEKQQKALDMDLESSNGEETHYGDHENFSVRETDPETLQMLNNQKTITTYKTMQLIDGKLYPPMAAVVAGNMEDYSELGQWERATEHPELIKNGNKFTLNKGKGKGQLDAAYNPYMHSSNLMINDQFSGAYNRDNLVTVECEVPVSELDSGYHAEFAKDSTGWHSWHTGTVAGQLRNTKGIERQVMLSRWIKPVRIVSEAEVAQHYKQLLDGTEIAVPDNVVTPQLLSELKKAGVKISESGKVKQPESFSIRDTYNMSWEEQVSKKLKRHDVLTLAQEGEMEQYGINKPITMAQGVLTKAQRVKQEGKSASAHELSETNIKNLKKNITHPVAKIVSKDGTVIVTDDTDPMDRYIIAAGRDIDQYHKGGTFDIKTVFGRDKMETLFGEYVDDKFVMNPDVKIYLYKNSAREILSKGSQQSGAGAEVLNAIDTLTQNEEESNSFSFRESAYEDAVDNDDMETAQWMVDQKADYVMENSKVRGADGKLLKMYHGTKAEFNEFRRDMIGSTGRFEGSGFNFTPYEGRAASYGKNVLAGYLDIEKPLSATEKTMTVAQLAKIIRETDPTGDNIISNYAKETRDYGSESFIRREALTAARQILQYSDNDVDIYSEISAADPDAESLIEKFAELGYDGLIHYDENGNIKTAVAFSSNQFKRADAAIYGQDNKLIPLSERFNLEKPDIRYSIRETDDGTFVDGEGNTLAEELPGGVVTSYSIRTVNDTVNDELIAELVKKGFSEKKVEKWVKDVRGIAKMIADDAQKLDFEALGGTMLKNNQEYIKTLDSSTLCAKRLLYQGIFNEIQHMLPNTPLMPDDLIKLTNMMKKRGLVTPCSICYVESRRRMLGKYASEWLKTYDGAYKPRIEEVTTTDGLQALRESDDENKRQAAQDFTDAMAAKGSANPKLVQLRSEYRGEIMDMTAKQIEKVKEIGGLRVQSFSDFETVHLLDMMQAVMDMAARDLTSQAYTKVPAFAWVFGDTGIKINLSLIGEGSGLDENGNLVFSNTEGMDFEEAMRIRSAYSKNVGTILVGMNDAHIIAAMGDDRIDFIIPFHKSGWSKKEMSLMIGMGQYKDFTRWQNEKKIASFTKTEYKTIPNKKSKISNFGPVNSSQTWDGQNGYWDFSKTGRENAEEYLRLCKEDGRVPKFANFLVYDGDGGFMLPTDNSQRSQNIRNGYWKTLIDFKMYDNSGKGSPQTTVTPNFNMEQARKIMNDYEGGADTLPTNHALAKDFVDEYKAENPRGSYSFRENPELDVRMWLEGVPESSLKTEAERMLLRQYKGLAKAIEINQENQRSLQRRISFMEEREKKLTQKEKYQLKGLKIRLENAKAAEKANQAKMDRFTAQEGFGKLMREQQEVINNFVQGKSQEEVNQAVAKMEKAAEKLQEDIDKTNEEIRQLAESKVIREVRSRIGNKTLDDAAARIRKNYNSTINKGELINELAKIRLMIQNGEQAEDINAEIEALAGRVLENRKSSEKNQSLEMLKGITLRLGESQVKELTGSDSGIKELRRMMAGSGVKVAKVKDGQGTLDANWDELISFVPALDGYNGIDTDNALNQPKAVAEFVMNAMEAQRESGKQEFEGMMGEVFANISEEVSRIVPNLPSDPASLKKILRAMEQYVEEMAGKASKAAQKIAETQLQVERVMNQGRNAAAWSRTMKGEIAQTIDYFNKTAKLAVQNEKKQKQDEIIRQLKDKHAQEMMRKNEEWRNLIERDAKARMQREDNNAARKRMTTIMNRISKLLVSPKNTENIPEHMNSLAREVLEKIVKNDLSEMTRKITNDEAKDLGDLARRLDAWKMRDGAFQPDDIQDEIKRDLVTIRLDELTDAIKEWNGKYRGKNALDTVQQMGKTLEKMENALSELNNMIKYEQNVALWHRQERIVDFANYVKYGTEGKEKAKELTGVVGRKLAAIHKAIVTGNMTPEYFFRMIGNEGLSELWDAYHKAENANGLEMRKAQQKLESIAEKYGYKDWDLNQKIMLKLEKGGEVELTLGQIMSLWATWNREQILGPEMSNHLGHGGFYAEQDLKEGVLGKKTIEKKAHRMTIGDWGMITSEILTDEQKKFIEEIVHFMSHDMSQLGNEASMAAYGIKMYKEKYYYPFKMWEGIKDKRSNDSGNAANINQAFHPSFSKSRMHGANNALIIGDFMETVTDHIIGMINYATMGLANDSMQKVLNYKFEEGDEENKTKRNLRTVLEEAYGRESISYLRELIRQLNGGAVATQRTVYDKMISLFRKNAVAGSLSVALQQPLSYIRAAMMINPKYLAEAMNPATWKGSYQEMLQHSGVAVIKDMGRFDMNLGQSAREYLMPDGKESKGRKAWNQITDKATILPEMMDRMTWTRMWSAVKLEQKAQHPEMDPKSDEFLDLVGERFNELMRRTQVYDSTLVKSQNMRNTNPVIKNMTSFMAEPTLTLNVLADAVRMAKNGEKGGKLMVAKAGATFMLSAVLAAAFKGLTGAGRNPDEDKTWWENFLYRFGNSIISEIDPMTMIPGYGDLVTVLKEGELSDDAMGAVGKIFTSAKKGVDLLSGKANSRGWYRDVEDSAAQLVQLFSSLPLKNIMRDARAMYNFITQPYAQRETMPAVLKYQGLEQIHNADNLIGVLNQYLGEAGYEIKNAAYYQRIYNAKKAGNDEKAQDIRDFLIYGKGVKDKTIDSAVKKLATSDEDTSATEKAEFMLEEGMDPGSFITQQVKAGEIRPEEARRLLKEQDPELTDDQIWWKVDRAEYTRETGKDVGTQSYYRLWDAMDANKSDEIKSAVSLMTEHGMEAKNIKTQITKQYKAAYLDADNDGKRKIRDAIHKAYKALGYTTEDADKIINAWK